MTDSIHRIDEVVVKGAAIRREIIPVQTLSGQQLELLNAYSVADALRYFAGIQVKDYGGVGGLKTVNVRSMGSQHVGVFYDGVEIGNPQNGVVDLGRFSLDNMEAVALYNGQKSAIFQSAKDFSSASSIYLTTKKPRFTAAKGYHLKTAFKTGSFGLANPSVLWEQRLGSRLSSSFNADYAYSNGRYKFTDKVNNPDNPEAGGYKYTDTRRNGDVSILRLEHGLFGTVHGGEWMTRAYAYLSERGLPGSVVKKTPGFYTNEDRQWDRNLFVQGSFRKTITDFYTTRLLAKGGYDYLRYLSDPAKNDSGDRYFNNRYHVYEAYLSSANYFNLLPFWSVNLSADLQWNKMDADTDEFIYPERRTVLAAAATSLDLGRLQVQGSLLATFVHESFREKLEKKTDWSRYTPSLVLSWQPFARHDFHVRAFYKRIFRMPTFNELYLTLIGSGRAVLRPENATQYNVGFTCSRTIPRAGGTRIEWQADGYYNEVTDKLLAQPGGTMFRWTMKNLGRVKIWGSDLALSTHSRFGADWRLNTRLNYTYQDARDYSNPDPVDAAGTPDPTYKGRISYTPQHSGSAVLTLGYGSWDLNYSFIYTGERYTESDNKPENLVQEWYTNDLGVTKTFVWGENVLRLSGEVNNIFNQQYDIVLNYPMPGTNVKFTVSWSF
ncbi:TonB-dependent receptor [Alistipes sp. OttesenSCG-928-L06]|nr:TonB-dependent receptor [Alistipes sp. OttesenSCG-928-L06]